MATDMLNETMGFGGKVPSHPIWTYSEQEGGMSLPYQLSMTVSAKVGNLSSEAEENLVDHMKGTLGYSECVTDKRKNTIYVESITAVSSSEVLKYIKKNIDPNARNRQNGRQGRR